jgi:protein-tyrosine phosphatase
MLGRSLTFLACGLLIACAEPAGRDVGSASPRLHIDLADPASGTEPAVATPSALGPATATEQDAEAPRPDTGRSVLAPYLTNARDLGGTPVGTRGVAYGRLFRGPPVAALSEAACGTFASLGIRSIVDLRDPVEVESAPDSACVREHAALTLAPLPRPYSVSPQDYIAMLDTTASIAATFRVLGDPAAYPVYFHCTLGRDRTGVVAALILLTLGASREAILEEYSLSSASVGAFPYSLVSTLDEVERRGGVEAYLTSVGVTHEQLTALRVSALP